MRIFVCVKQVPDSAKVEVDPATGVLKRDGVDSKMNPYDLYAVETALRLRERARETGLEDFPVAAITMGPPQAVSVLREAVMMGCDRGVLLTDRRFAGSDVLATSYALAQGIRKTAGGTDGLLVVCGRQTTDGDTAQVGPEIAEFLGIPHVADVKRVAGLKADSLVVESEIPGMVELSEVPLPCLIAVDKETGVPRLPSYVRKRAMTEGMIETIGLDGLEDADPKRYGLDGSPTRVVKIFPPPEAGARELWTGSGPELADRIHARLVELKFVGGPS